VLAAAASRGVLGCVVLAEILLRAAVIAAVVLARSRNVFEGAVVAFPVWTLAWVAGLVVMLAPLSAWGARFPPRPLRDSGFPHRPLLIGAGLVAAAVLLRLAAAAPYADLAQRLTAR
jgi:hypothetical protein